LAPKPVAKFVRLQRLLHKGIPVCDDLVRIAAGSTPYLRVGQARTAEAGRRLQDELQALWQPLRFELSRTAVIQRISARPFAVAQWIALCDGTW